MTFTTAEAPFRHRVLKAGTCLIDALIDELLSLSESDLHQCHVVLPTQRLHLYLARSLIDRLGHAALLPKLWTWEQFLDECLLEFEGDELVMGSSQCELIMEHVIRNRRTSSPRLLHTSEKHAHELVHFASELVRAGYSPLTAKEKLIEKMKGDWTRSHDLLSEYELRLDDIFDGILEFEAVLDAQGWTTKDRTRRKGLSSVLNGTHVPRLGLPRGNVYIAGLTSVPPQELELLARWASEPSVTLWVDDPPHGQTQSPLIKLATAAKLNPPQLPTESHIKAIYKAANVTLEVSFAIHRAKELIAQGLHPHDIAIVVPDENGYGPAFRALLAHDAMSVNMPLALPGAASMIGRWFSLVTTLAAGRDLIEFGQYLLHPYTQSIFDAPAGFDEHTLQHALHLLWDDHRDLNAWLAPLQGILSADDYSFVTRAVSWCENGSPGELVTMYDDVRRVLTKISALPASKTYLENLAGQNFEQALQALERLEPFSPSIKKDWPQFIRNTNRVAMDIPLREIGEPLCGLQILGLTEARYVPFKAVIIVGVVEGVFPRSLPRDSLVDNFQRRIIGLPGWSELEALEDTTFHLLSTRLAHVELTYPLEVSEIQTSRSRWIEKIAPDVPPQAVDHAAAMGIIVGFGNATSENSHSPTTSLTSGKALDYEDLIKKVAVSKLEMLVKCPYKFLISERKVKRVDLPEDRITAVIGSCLHKILELFFTPNFTKNLPDSLHFHNMPPTPSDFEAWAEERLPIIANQIVPSDLKNHVLMRQMKGSGWLKIVKFYSKLLEAGFDLRSAQVEKSVGEMPRAIVPAGNRHIEIFGKLDIILQSSNATALIDYKSSFSVNDKAMSEGLLPQLPLYALAVSQIDAKSHGNSHNSIKRGLAAIYYNLEKGRPVGVYCEESTRGQFRETLDERAKAPSLNTALSSHQALLSLRLDDIGDTGQFEAQPIDCNFCNFADICRINDPRYVQAMRERAKQFKERAVLVTQPNGSSQDPQNKSLPDSEGTSS